MPTKSLRCLQILCLSAVFVWTAPAVAQDRGVLLFPEKDFGGQARMFAADARDVGIAAASVKLALGTNVASLFARADFGGRCITIWGPIRDLSVTPLTGGTIGAIKVDVACPDVTAPSTTTSTYHLEWPEKDASSPKRFRMIVDGHESFKIRIRNQGPAVVGITIGGVLGWSISPGTSADVYDSSVQIWVTRGGSADVEVADGGLEEAPWGIGVGIRRPTVSGTRIYGSRQGKAKYVVRSSPESEYEVTIALFDEQNNNIGSQTLQPGSEVRVSAPYVAILAPNGAGGRAFGTYRLVPD